jgi:hypothetical protein
MPENGGCFAILPSLKTRLVVMSCICSFRTDLLVVRGNPIQPIQSDGTIKNGASSNNARMIDMLCPANPVDLNQK